MEDAITLAPARTCDDCYFRRKQLCALARTEPCPTFRAIRQGRIQQPRQAVLVPLTENGSLPLAEDALVALAGD